MIWIRERIAGRIFLARKIRAKRFGAEKLRRLETVGGSDDGVARFGEQLLERIEQRLVVVNDQDAGHDRGDRPKADRPKGSRQTEGVRLLIYHLT